MKMYTAKKKLKQKMIWQYMCNVHKAFHVVQDSRNIQNVKSILKIIFGW